MKTSVAAPLLLALAGCLSTPGLEQEAAGVRGRDCTPDRRYPYLCANVPDDGLFLLTSYGGDDDESASNDEFACGGGYPDGRGWYATSWVRWGCGAKLEVMGDRGCAVVEVEDAGPAAWVEREAGMPVLDASPQVCESLFGLSSCGWSDELAVTVAQVDDRTPVGPSDCRRAGGDRGGRDDGRGDDRGQRDDDRRGRDDGRGAAPENWGSCNTSWGDRGICVDAGACRRHGGSTERYRCPGPAEIQCCVE